MITWLDIFYGLIIDPKFIFSLENVTKSFITHRNLILLEG